MKKIEYLNLDIYQDKSYSIGIFGTKKKMSGRGKEGEKKVLELHWNMNRKQYLQ